MSKLFFSAIIYQQTLKTINRQHQIFPSLTYQMQMMLIHLNQTPVLLTEEVVVTIIHNTASGVHFCGGSHVWGSCGQGSQIHRGSRRGGRGCRTSHGRCGCGHGGGHGEKKASQDKSKTPAPIEWKSLENPFENHKYIKPYFQLHRATIRDFFWKLLKTLCWNFAVKCLLDE